MTENQLDKTNTKTSLLNYIVENSQTYDIYNEQNTKKPNSKKEKFNYIIKYVTISLLIIILLYFTFPQLVDLITKYIKN